MDNTLYHNCKDGCYMTTFMTLCEHVDKLWDIWLNKTNKGNMEWIRRYYHECHKCKHCKQW